MRPLYIIVRDDCIPEKSDNPGVTKVIEEINKIRREGYHILIRNPRYIPPELDKNRPMLVCGAYYDGFDIGWGSGKECVDIMLETLRNSGYFACVYMPGTLLSLSQRHRQQEF